MALEYFYPKPNCHASLHCIIENKGAACYWFLSLSSATTSVSVACCWCIRCLYPATNCFQRCDLGWSGNKCLQGHQSVGVPALPAPASHTLQLGAVNNQIWTNPSHFCEYIPIFRVNKIIQKNWETSQNMYYIHIHSNWICLFSCNTLTVPLRVGYKCSSAHYSMSLEM